MVILQSTVVHSHQIHSALWIASGESWNYCDITAECSILFEAFSKLFQAFRVSRVIKLRIIVSEKVEPIEVLSYDFLLLIIQDARTSTSVRNLNVINTEFVQIIRKGNSSSFQWGVRCARSFIEEILRRFSKGTFSCHCKHGYTGNGLKSGSGCKEIPCDNKAGFKMINECSRWSAPFGCPEKNL